MKVHHDEGLAIHIDPESCAVTKRAIAQIVRVWSAETGRPISELPREYQVKRAAFSPDGRRFLVATWTGEVRVHETETGVKLSALGGLAGIVNTADFSSDKPQLVHGQWLVATGESSAVYLWDVGRTRALVTRPMLAGVVVALGPGAGVLDSAELELLPPLVSLVGSNSPGIGGEGTEGDGELLDRLGRLVGDLAASRFQVNRDPVHIDREGGKVTRRDVATGHRSAAAVDRASLTTSGPSARGNGKSGAP